jgi:general secretion pathway protein G
MNEASIPSNRTTRVARVKTRWSAAAVVLGVAVILAGVIVAPRSGSGPGIARLTAAKAQIAVLGTALGAFRVDNGYFPTGTNGPIYLMKKPPGATKWRGPYMQPSVPFDPWGHAFIYECPGRHNPQSYDLSAMGPEGQVAACNWQKE